MKINQRGEACYSSFEELAKAFNVKPVVKVTKDKEKLKAQQERFVSRHKCKACGEPMTYINGTSIMTCTNDKCKGIPYETTDADGNKKVNYLISYDLLDEVGSEIASNILG